MPGEVKRNHLFVHAVLVEDGLAVRDIAVPAYHDVVVAGIVEQGIAFPVFGDAHVAGTLADGIEIGGRVVMIVKIDNGHRHDLLYGRLRTHNA